jgi:23S rRNA pseudouridine2605 synthase
MKSGISTNEETLTARQCRLIRSGEKNSWLEIVLDEGRNRQIRRMLAALDIEVLRLLRIAIGPLHLGNLEKGTYRALTLEEKLALDHAMELNSGMRRPSSKARSSLL